MRGNRACAAVAAVTIATVVGACQRAEAPPPAPARLSITVTDGPGGPPIAARVLFWDGDQPVRFGTAELYGGARQVAGACDLGPGVIGTWHGLLLAYGTAELPVGGGDTCEPSPALPLGRYRVWAWRGFEYERWEGEVVIGAGQAVTLTIPLVRAWDADGALAADLHVHAARSNDSKLPDRVRVISQLASGIEVTALSDHASAGDLDQAITALGLDGAIASIASNEAGNDVVHLGVYPVPVDPAAPRGGSPPAEEFATWTPAAMMTWGHGLPGRPLVQVNHPRFRVYALFDNAGWDGVRWPPPFSLDFDAVEVLSGHTAFNAPGDRRLDAGVRDFYTLAAHGVKVVGVGASDVHHLNGVLDGVARTYVLDQGPIAHFDEAAFVGALRARRAVATTGPWLDVEVVDAGGGPSAGPGQALRAPSGRVRIDVELAQASWVHATELRVRVGGTIVRTEAIPPGATRHRVTVDVPVTAPTWIGVDAGGDEPLPIEMTGTYQVEKQRPGVVPYAIVNPIWIEDAPEARPVPAPDP